MSKEEITVSLSTTQLYALREWDEHDASPVDLRAVWRTLRAALPLALEIGCLVEPNDDSNYSFYPAEVIAVRGTKVFCIDKDGDACQFDLWDVAVVEDAPSPQDTATMVVVDEWRVGEFVEVCNSVDGSWETGVVAYVDTTSSDGTQLLVWVASEDLDVTDVYHSADDVRQAERPEWWPAW